MFLIQAENVAPDKHATANITINDEQSSEPLEVSFKPEPYTFSTSRVYILTIQTGYNTPEAVYTVKVRGSIGPYTFDPKIPPKDYYSFTETFDLQVT